MASTGSLGRGVFREVQRAPVGAGVLPRGVLLLVAGVCGAAFVVLVLGARSAVQGLLAVPILVLPWIILAPRIVHWLREQVVTEVYGDAVRVRIEPGRGEAVIAAEDVAACEVDTHPCGDALLAFGIQPFDAADHPQAQVTIRGDRGVRLTLRDGREVFIGSQLPEALAAAIRRRIPEDSPTSEQPN